MLRAVKWDKYGVVDGKARDPRCEHCMVPCGYDPSGALGTNYQSGDNWKNFKYNFGTKPAPFPSSPELKQSAYNGVTVGKGHLAEAKAAINSPRAAMNGAQSVFQRKGHHDHDEAGMDTTQRDEVLAKVDAAKKIELKPE